MRGFIKEAESLGPGNPHVITSVARLLSFYAHWRFVHFHGQKTSRQVIGHSIYKGNRRKRTILIGFFSPILFFFPDDYLRELEKVWVDGIIVEALWKESIQKLVSEWGDFVLYSTVTLTANVSFLAIPGVIPQNAGSPNAWTNHSPAQITSSISLVFSIGSIITGLLFIRRNRNMMTKDPRSAWNYLYGMKWPVVGLEPLAIAFSLTYALLMWSVLSFFAALLMFSFQDTSRIIRIPVGAAAGVVAISMIWCIKNTWDQEEKEEESIDRLYEPDPEIGNGSTATHS
ncbi:hypothetical protein EI94DRAFT_679057 [Lactarius quietus]|nr:hypothetical protein EI94DRAFT_679057 [Lactarius quietus]